MAYEELIREFDLILWTAANFLTLFNSIFTLRLVRNERLDKSQRHANLTWGLYFLFMLFGNILNIVWRLYLVETAGMDIAKLVEKISLIMISVGWLVIIGYFDRKMLILKKPYFFYIMCISTLLTIIVGFHQGTILEIIYFITTSIGFSVFPILFLMISRRSEGILKKNARRIFIAAVLFGVGLLVQTQNVEPFLPQIIALFESTLHLPYLIVSPIMIIISMITFWLGIWNLYLYNIEIE
ncbi:MAG: hypothetical protein GF364_13160 [Candidatus Lokiarchaeota archaeon]|nr:hypothetical protein [Candidatus Lokiarchaeota archaeon]